MAKSLEILDHNFLQEARKNDDPAGSTACGVAFYGPDEEGQLKLITANLGDSRAFLSRNGKSFRLTEDHKPNRKDEEARIKKEGGTVSEFAGGIARVVCNVGKTLVGIAVSRAIGDRVFKEPNKLISNKAETNCYDINLETDEFVVITSDGILDVLTEDTVVRHLRARKSLEDLIKYAVERGAHDDCTITVIRFGWHQINRRVIKKDAMRACAELGKEWEGSDLEESDEEEDLAAGVMDDDEEEDSDTDAVEVSDDEPAIVVEDENAEEADVPASEEEIAAATEARKKAILADMMADLEMD